MDIGSRRRVNFIWCEEIDRRVHSIKMVEGFSRMNSVAIRDGITMERRMFGIVNDMVNMV